MGSDQQRICMRRDTYDNLYASNPILLDGEIVFVRANDSSKIIGIKIGDGTTDFINLPDAITNKDYGDMIWNRLQVIESNMKINNCNVLSEQVSLRDELEKLRQRVTLALIWGLTGILGAFSALIMIQ